MAKLAPLGVRLEPEVKAGLERAAATNLRSLSNLVEMVLSDWLKQHGYLAPTDAEGRRQAPMTANA